MARRPMLDGLSRSRSRMPLIHALLVLLAALMLAGAPEVHARSRQPAVAGEILVKLTDARALRPLRLKYGLVVLDQFGSRPIYRLGVNAFALNETIEAMSLEPDVLIVERNYIHEAPEARKNVVWAFATPQDYAAQWAPEAIRLAQAHQLTTGAGMRVAVLDTGVDATHPLLAGRLLPGFDFVDFDADPSEVPGGIAYGHGTHVAGIIAMVAPAAQVMPLRVLDVRGRGNAWVLAEAILYAIDPDGNPATDDGAHVINLSLGTTERTRLLDSIVHLASCTAPDDGDPVDSLVGLGYENDRVRCAGSLGAVVVAAAGNDASVSLREYPAAEGSYGLLAVAASAPNLTIAPFSNRGTWIDVAAPGDLVTSAIPGGGYGTWSGTSMAAPIVAGTIALMRSVDPITRSRDLASRLPRRAPTLCGGTQHVQVDASAAVGNRAPDPLICP